MTLHNQRYSTFGAEEHFLSFVTQGDKLAGYLRLSLPGPSAPETGLPEIQGAALVREVHIYGQSMELGSEAEGVAQHSGLGVSLMENAEDLARDHGYPRIAVIAALGTRGYYKKLGYNLGETYMLKVLD